MFLNTLAAYIKRAVMSLHVLYKLANSTKLLLIYFKATKNSIVQLIGKYSGISG